MKKHNLSTLILLMVFFAGLAILLYPTVSDLWNSMVQSRAIAKYDDILANMSKENYIAEFEKADEYNRLLNEISSPLINYDQVEGYNDTLNVTENGVIGYIEIPKIAVKLPIYHGTSEAVLNVAVGHLEGTSLPVGGESTHAVLSAHRGLPSAKLFTNLDRMEDGDIFTVIVLDRVLTYQVDQIRIVGPHEVDELNTVEGEDYVTLLTCTPYGINTHRLLVRGHRIENDEKTQVVIKNEAYELDSTMLAPIAATPLLFILLIILLVKHRNPKIAERGQRSEQEKKEGSHE